MGKRDKESLGRSLVKSRFGASRGKRTVDNGSMLHSTVVQDGYEWGRLNLQSVTEESSFQEFLSTAELANTEFQAEKLNLKLVSITSGVEAVSTTEMRANAKIKHDASKHLLRVPRRPKWSREMSADEVKDNERQAFLDWRRDLATLQDKDGLILTPYEKNLEFWRQLWRVLERSNVLIQVVDARNPLLFRCEDLETYAKEVGVQACLLLLNKSDLLTEKLRTMWAEYFDQQGVKVAFFSAALAAEKNKIRNADEEGDEENNESDDDDSDASDVSEKLSKLGVDEIKDRVENLEKSVEATCEKLAAISSKLSDIVVKKETSEPIANLVENKPKSVTFDESLNAKAGGENVNSNNWNEKNQIDILDKEQLLDLLRSIQIDCSGRLTIGLVGYPNVGKSSTINALLNAKKVSVSATPGKTKHFQTLLLEDDLMLCDCPGLVLPSFVCTKAEMVVHGILPIDQMREYMDAVGLVAESIGGRRQAERRLGILLPPPPTESPDALPPRDLLNAYAYSRGMMTGMGTPDCARAARAVLRAATKGFLPLVVTPPGFDVAEYMSTLHPPLPELPVSDVEAPRRQMTPQEARALKMAETREDLDSKFFAGAGHEAYTKGVPGKFHGLPTERAPNANDDVQVAGKPWKHFNKHVNKKKKEKLRRVYAHLDQH